MAEHKKFTGIYSILYALFDEKGQLDFQLMEKQIDVIIGSKCHGIAILGLATEVLKLSFIERKQLITHSSRYIQGRVPFCVTIAGNSIDEQIELAQYAQKEKADWLILQPPLVGSYGADEYIHFFASVAKSVDIPVSIQNAKAYLGRDLSAEEIRTLCNMAPNMTHLKAESTPLEIQKVKKAAPDLTILNGRGGLEMIDNLYAGCEGFILAPDISDWAVEIFNLWKENPEKAEELYRYCLPEFVFVMTSIEHLITYGKRIFGYRANIPIYDRKPCLAVDDFGLQMAKKYADHLGAYKSS